MDSLEDFLALVKKYLPWILAAPFIIIGIGYIILSIIFGGPISLPTFPTI